VPVTRRSRVIAATPEAVWRVIADPHQLPRWWPGVRRVEGVGSERFTQVLFTAKERPVRVDIRIVASQPGRSLSWEQELAGTPFERYVAQAVTELELADEGGGTNLTIAQRQQLRGFSRGGGWMVRRATGKRLDDALGRLDELLGAPQG
jgi:uncharacterized protein YndB with AHSA1/START domain